jgi:hypothetical protein
MRDLLERIGGALHHERLRASHEPRRRTSECGETVRVAATVDETDEIRDFLDRFRSEAPRYLDAHSAKFGEDAARELLGLVIGTYKHILLGETKGRRAVRVIF